MYERRFTTQATLRATDPGGGIGPTIEGWAARWNVLSHDLGGFREKIQRGAFTRSIQSDRDVMCLVNHDNNKILGRRRNRTLSLDEDGKGLHFSCLLPDTSDGRDIAQLLKRQDISECSFAFAVDDDGDEWGEDEDPDDRSRRCQVRTLRNVKLFDVSVVSSPAYPSTSVGLNSLPPQRSYTTQDYFPEGIPAEVRSHIGAAILNPRAQESRRRVFNLFLG